MSLPEAKLWTMLRREPFETFHFRRQVEFGPYYADFASHGAKLVIEVDGATHFEDAQIEYDARRTAFIESQSYRVIRFTGTQILGRSADVAATIGAHLGLGP